MAARSEHPTRARRVLSIVIPVLSIAIAGLIILGLPGGCTFSSVDAALPNGEGIVNNERPLTSDQAYRVATAGSTVIKSMVDPMLALGLRPHKATPPSERWSGCQAAHLQIYSDGTDNGAKYAAVVRFESAGYVPFSALEHALAAVPGVTLQGASGESGVFAVSVHKSTSNPRFAAVQVVSPCYFIRKIRGDGSVNSDDVALVTGFISRELVLPS